MPWYPHAIRKPLTVPARARSKLRMNSPKRINLHTAVSNSTSLFGFFNSPAARGVFSHFYVREDGTVEQYQDTSYRASCDLDGNADTISIETWDGYGRLWTGYAGPDKPGPWTPAQASALAALIRWLHTAHPTIPRKLATSNARNSDSHGLSWHQLGSPGTPGYITGGYRYTTSRGKICPGPKRIAQIPAIHADALRTTENPQRKESEMPLTPDEIDAIASRVWSASFGTETAGARLSIARAGTDETKALRAELARLNAALTGTVDMDAIRTAVADGVRQALAAARVELHIK